MPAATHQRPHIQLSKVLQSQPDDDSQQIGQPGATGFVSAGLSVLVSGTRQVFRFCTQLPIRSSESPASRPQRASADLLRSQGRTEAL